MENTIATRVVVILDCCYSGSAKISKGNEEDAAKRGMLIIEQKSRKLPEGQGKYILSSSQSHQEAYALTTGEHSIFTYYLLKGLSGNRESLDSEGNVTPQSLGNYVIRAIMSLPPDERPKQRPVIKAEESGNVILASYPKLIPPPANSVPNNSIYESPTKTHETTVHKGILRSRTKISIAFLATAVIAAVIALALFDHYNHLPTTQSTATKAPANVSATQMLSNYKYVLYNKGDDLLGRGNYTQAIPFLDKAIAIDPKFEDALFDKGDALNYLGNYTGALTYLNRALAIDPHDKYALSDKGWALDDLGNYTGAIPFLDKALSIDPNYKWALNNKGWALYGLGNYTGAIKFYDKALVTDPKLEIALYNKGDTLKSLGNYTGAITYLNRALAIDPNDRYAKLDLAQANRLHVVELAQPTHHNATLQRPSVSR